MSSALCWRAGERLLAPHVLRALICVRYRHSLGAILLLSAPAPSLSAEDALYLKTFESQQVRGCTVINLRRSSCTHVAA